jgi:hypothetical protein
MYSDGICFDGMGPSGEIAIISHAHQEGQFLLVIEPRGVDLALFRGAVKASGRWD